MVPLSRRYAVRGALLGVAAGALLATLAAVRSAAVGPEWPWLGYAGLGFVLGFPGSLVVAALAPALGVLTGDTIITRVVVTAAPTTVGWALWGWVLGRWRESRSARRMPAS